MDRESDDSFEAIFLFLEFDFMGGREGSDSSGDIASSFGGLDIMGGSKESGISEDTAFLFLLAFTLDPVGPFPTITLVVFATGEADVVADSFSVIIEAALKRADRLVDILYCFDDCREKCLIDELTNLNDRALCSLVTEM